MSLSLQNIIDDCSYETRLMVDGTAGSGAAFNLLTRFVDQAYKDAIHTGLYFTHLRAVENVTTVAATYNYTMTATNIASVEHVYDVTFQRELLPRTQIVPSASGVTGNTADPRHLPEYNASNSWDRTNSRMPEFYELLTTTTAGTNSHVLYLYPPPATSAEAGVLAVHYLKEVPTLAAASDKLMIPEDGRALVVAGALAKTFMYLKRLNEANAWAAKFEALKKGERIGN